MNVRAYFLTNMQDALRRSTIIGSKTPIVPLSPRIFSQSACFSAVVPVCLGCVSSLFRKEKLSFNELHFTTFPGRGELWISPQEPLSVLIEKGKVKVCYASVNTSPVVYRYIVFGEKGPSWPLFRTERPHSLLSLVGDLGLLGSQNEIRFDFRHRQAASAVWRSIGFHAPRGNRNRPN